MIDAAAVAADRARYLLGLARFNAGEWHACHDALEHLWLRNRSPARPFFQGLIQIAAGFHHLESGRFIGATRLWAAGSERLVPYGPSMLGLEVAPLLLDLGRCLAHAEELGPAQLSAFDRTLLPQLRFAPPSLEAFAPHAGTVRGPTSFHRP